MAWIDLKTLRCELEHTPNGAVLWLTLNRPAAYNSLSMEMLQELHTVFAALEHPRSMHEPLPPDHPRVVVLRGAGRAFSGGVDIKAADQGLGGSSWDYKDMRSQQILSRLIERMRAVPQPIIAAVQVGADQLWAEGGYVCACDRMFAGAGHGSGAMPQRFVIDAAQVDPN